MKLKKIEANIIMDNKMQCVHDNDLESLLQSLKVYDRIIEGKYKCLFCDRVITMDNLDSIVPYNGKVEFTCDSQKCHAKLIGLGD